MTKVYDLKTNKNFQLAAIEDAKYGRFSKITFKNAHLVGRELDYIVLYWKRKNPILETVILEQPYSCHRLIEGLDWVQVKNIKNIFEIDVNPLLEAIKTKNKDEIRGWCLMIFSSGYDPIYWIELLPEDLRKKLEESLNIWFDMIWYDNTQELMRQVIFWYATIWNISSNS
jgi:hypothetical protein